ncbi:MAG: conjugal transfer protein TraN, partial [Planctomycetota bacterium]
MRRALILLGLLVSSGAALAGEITCETPVFVSCQTQSDSATAGPLTLDTHCTKEVGSKLCFDEAPLDQCLALDATGSCVPQSEECIDYRNGRCEQLRHVFECTNENGDMAPAILLETRYGPIQEEILDDCADLESNPRCSLARTETLEGAETRTINGNDVFRAWWTRERVFSCRDGLDLQSNCQPLEANPACTLTNETCLARDQGTCTDWQYRYLCGTPQTETGGTCRPVNVCAG